MQYETMQYDTCAPAEKREKSPGNHVGVPRAMSFAETIATGLRLAGSARGFVRPLAAALLAVAAAGALTPLPAAAEAKPSAVVVMYHRFGESRHPSTNISLQQFEAHINELRSGKYRVLGLPEIVDAVRRGKPLPDRAVALSVDDAFLSLYREGWPRLKKAGLPFTLFIVTGALDRGSSDYMSWDQIKELAAAGVTIGSQTESHPHMPAESRERNLAELDRSNRRIEEMLGKRPDLIAYPYGESSLEVQEVAKQSGFIAGFGQHSGVIGGDGNLFDLPRFAMNEDYGDMGRFRLAVNALPLPVADVTPADPLVGATNPPAMGFSVAGEVKGLGRLSCFLSHEGRARLERLGERRFEVRVSKPFPKGRTRLNCTMPAEDGRWRWFGRQFYIPE